MRKLLVFNMTSLDGFFTDQHGDMSWAHSQDPEWARFTNENASGDAVLLFGRITYQLMEKFWPTEAAFKSMPIVAERMNSASKVVFSKTLEQPTWNNTKLVKGELENAVQAMKQAPGPDLVLMGSGTIVSQLAQARLIDSYQIVVTPIVLGKGRPLFETVTDKLRLKLEKTRTFENGNVVLWYRPA